ncbi:MAG TPA: hypothetical protein DEG43_15585 [Acidimicrobiaceae bacterium]|jgi:cytochrome c-type biogenesis protein|nr:hypothetical protein [Acidimicrobiaceae bacterium]
MSEYFEAFLLGNAAIIGNVCMLPLYPGLFVMLASRLENGATPRSVRWMGALVLAGVLTAMLSIGFLLHLLRTPFADVLPYSLPVMYAAVAILGVAMLFDKNPFVRMQVGPITSSGGAALQAFLYGVSIGPMTLPCTGPLIISAFVLGGVQGSGALIDALTYFLFFGLGFGWPLVLAPLLAAPVQQRLTRLITKNHRAVTIFSGLLLIAVAIVGFVKDVAGN